MSPAGGFGKFLLVVLALSIVGNSEFVPYPLSFQVVMTTLFLGGRYTKYLQVCHEMSVTVIYE